VIYCVGAKLIISILALVWALPQPQPIFIQGFAIGVLPIWSEALASRLLKFEPAREVQKYWLYVDAATDIAVFLMAPLVWLCLSSSGGFLLQFGMTVFLAAGLFRIGRFLKSGLDSSGYFQGLPVTYTGYIWPIMMLAPSNWLAQIATAILLAAGVAMVLPHRFIKASR
jgi:hypothetical protein